MHIPALEDLEDLPAGADLRLRPGVYVIVQVADGKVKYVGQTGCVGLRLKEHERTKRYNPKADRVKVSWEGNPERRLVLETLLILSHRPRLNRAIKIGLTKEGRLYEMQFLRGSRPAT